MFHLNKIIKNLAFIFGVIALSLGLSCAVLAVWQEPALSPPDGNVDAPVNVGISGQIKRGALGLNFGNDGSTGGAPNGLIIYQGKVGIGTPAPFDKLTISSILSGADDSSIAIINKNPTDTKARLRFITDMGEFLIGRVSSTYTLWPAAAGDVFFNLGGKDPADCAVPLGPNGCPSNNNIRFFTMDNSGNSGERMIITANGNVGIGTANPSVKLNVMIDKINTEGIHITRNDNSANRWSYLHIQDELANTIFKVHENGNVGIGTTGPEQKLEINGGVRLNTTAAKPACDATKRGTFWFTQSVAGVTDKIEACVKNKSDNYVWEALVRKDPTQVCLIFGLICFSY